MLLSRRNAAGHCRLALRNASLVSCRSGMLGPPWPAGPPRVQPMPIADGLVLTPPGPPEPSLAIAACRAGARGFLDLEYAAPQPALEAVARLERFAGTPFGVKVGPGGAALLDRLLTARPSRL